jgi:transposase-like protein
MAKRGRKPSFDLDLIACRNESCPNFGKPGAPTLVANGSYLTKSGKGQRYRCKTCGQSFCIRSGTIFYDLRNPDEKVISALKLLLKGVTIRHTAGLLGTKPDTIRSWLRLAARQRQESNRRLLLEPGVTQEQLDALWKQVDNDQLRARAVMWRKRRGWRS